MTRNAAIKTQNIIHRTKRTPKLDRTYVPNMKTAWAFE